MYYQFLIEDQSSEVLVKKLMEQLKSRGSDFEYDCKSFKGIGGFSKKGFSNVKEIKTGKLLNDLIIYLRGFNKSLQGINSAIFVILDNDDRDTSEFRNELIVLAQQNMIMIDHVFCIAVEEVEAWLLGDSEALVKAYPQCRISALDNYVQDSICGTWEVLADVLYPGGYNKLMKNKQTYAEIGKLKYEWAEKIAPFMKPESNKSVSFRYFWDEVQIRLAK